MQLNLSPCPFLAALAGFALLVTTPSPSWAQGDEDDEDDEEDEEDDEDGEYEDEDDEEDDEDSSDDLDREERRRPARRSKRADRRKKADAPSREVVKGAYAKINIGPIWWVPPSSNYLSNPGTKIDFAFGYDFIDRLSFTMSVEGAFYNLITNGTGVSECGVGGALCPTPTGSSPTQGDLRFVGGTVALRFGPNFGGKRTKRGHIGFKIGAGVGYSPPLVDLSDPVIISRTGVAPTSSAQANLLQGRPLLLVTPAVVIEGYTKLSHFSIGIEIGGDIVLLGPVPVIGIVTTVALKYTF
jgi:hypothetical protein